jgi:hypothetical protein
VLLDGNVGILILPWYTMELFANLVCGNASGLNNFVIDWQRYHKGCNAESLLSGVITLRNKVKVECKSLHDIEWGLEFSLNRNANYLWLYSLDYVGTLVDAYSRGFGEIYLDCAVSIVESFCRFYHESEGNKTKIAYLNKSGASYDHATSTRANILVRYLCAVIKSDRKVDLSPVISCIHDAAIFMYDDRNHSESNHGVMTDIALSQIGVLAGLSSELGMVFFEKANDRLIDSVLRTFDSDGYANENTVGYHRFNVQLFKSVISKFSDWGVESRFGDIAPPIIDKALRAFQICVWQDGSIPPIGDSAVYENAAESLNISKVFSESGMAVIKDDDLYVSLICGRRGDAHKQVDDTSITVRYKNTDIVIDGGHLSYDRLDPYRLSLESSLGHSGVFPEFIEGIPSNSYLEVKQAASITNISKSDASVDISAQLSFPDHGYAVNRTVSVIFPRLIVIRDEIDSEDCEMQTTQRFLFGKNLNEIEFNQPGVLTLHDKDFRVIVTMKEVSSGLTLCRGLVGERPRGWSSQKSGVKDPCYELTQKAIGGKLLFETCMEIIDAQL